MKQTRSYGVVCPKCQTKLEVGRVDLEPDAGEEALQRVLSESGWVSRIVECAHRQCSFGKLCRQDEMILLG